MEKPKSICVYCGASGSVNESFRQSATDLGALLARENIRLVYGGGSVGLMGLVADAVMKDNGEVLGIIPEFLDKWEVGHRHLTDLKITSNMHERKMIMAEESDAFVVLPGGLGTLDETFEILTWKQLNLHDKPVIILNIDGFWDPLIALIKHQVAANFAKESNLDLFTVINKVEDLITALAEAPQSHQNVAAKWM